MSTEFDAVDAELKKAFDGGFLQSCNITVRLDGHRILHGQTFDGCGYALAFDSKGAAVSPKFEDIACLLFLLGILSPTSKLPTR